LNVREREREREREKFKKVVVNYGFRKFLIFFFFFFELLRDLRNSYYDHFDKEQLFLILKNSHS
jgi:hypothetical protein